MDKFWIESFKLSTSAYLLPFIFEQLKQLPMCRFPGGGGGCVRSDIDNFCHISAEIWQRLSSLFPFSRAFPAFPVFSAFPFFPPFPLFRVFFLFNKSLCGAESYETVSRYDDLHNTSIFLLKYLKHLYTLFRSFHRILYGKSQFDRKLLFDQMHEISYERWTNQRYVP